MFNDTEVVVGADERVTATVAHWCETPTKAGGFALPACSYGIALRVNGDLVRQLWGAGYAQEPIPTIALAVARILEIVKGPPPIIVEALAELSRYFGPLGIVSKAEWRKGCTGSGKKLACYPLMKRLNDAYVLGDWELVPLSKTWRGYPYLKANGLARNLAKKKALDHKAHFNPTPVDYPDAVILQGGAS